MVIFHSSVSLSEGMFWKCSNHFQPPLVVDEILGVKNRMKRLYVTLPPYGSRIGDQCPLKQRLGDTTMDGNGLSSWNSGKDSNDFFHTKRVPIDPENS